MKPRYILIIVILLTGFISKAQPDEINYLGNPAVVGFVDDGIYGPFPIGFNFTFYGNTYNEFYINSNGQILFGTGSLESAEAPIPSEAAPNNFIAPFWDDLVVDSYGNILYKTVGETSPKRLIVQFTNMGFYPYPANLGTFTVILYETSNIIQIQYRLIVLASSAKAHGNSATIGLENAAGTSGIQYAYHNPAAVNTEQAISFTPIAGPTYTVNSNALYDGVFLTTNMTLPEPDIADLISPPQDAVICSDCTFGWASTLNASSYTLYIGNDPELIDAVSYPAGSNLTYPVTGLLLDTTYYWGVFAKNTTGITWCEIKRFTTSSAPPLTPVPQTIWVEQFQDKTIKLGYTGCDPSPKKAIITSLPAQGQLYQYNSGVRGSQISSVPDTINDAEMNLIYAATGSTTGNGVGNFKFLINDAGGDSPEGTITVNVSPPGVPKILYVAKSTINVEIQFDMLMSDPTGKQNQFTVKVNADTAVINSASLKANDPYTIVLTLETSLTGGETVLLSYTPGNVTGTTGGLLLPFTDQPVLLLAQNITFPTNLNKVYGDPSLGLTASSTSGLTGFTYSSSIPSVATIVGNILTIHAAGTADITARQAGNTTYAPAKYIKPLTVSKATLTVTADAKNKTYGAANPALTFLYSGWKYTDGPAVLTTVPAASTTVNLTTPVGVYPASITVAGGSANNYNFSYVPASFTVNKAMLTVTADAKSKTYGSANPALTFQYSGWKNGEDSSYLTTLPVASATVTILNPVATYSNAITVSGGADDNYAFTYIPADFTVTKADLTFIAEDKTKVIQQPNPELTYTISGFVNGETQSVLDVLPVIQTSSLQSSPAGSYPITFTGGSDDNYNYVFVDGTLTITRNLQTISFTDIPEKLLAGDTYTLVATSTSGLTVLFESLDPDVASISGDELTGLLKGNARIRAYHPGDINYEPAEAFDTVEIYSTHRDIMYLFTPNGDGINDYWELPELLTWGKCDVKVYNRWGKLVYSNPDYNNLWDGTSGGNPVPEGPYYFVIKTENAGMVKGTMNIVR